MVSYARCPHGYPQDAFGSCPECNRVTAGEKHGEPVYSPEFVAEAMASLREGTFPYSGQPYPHGDTMCAGCHSCQPERFPNTSACASIGATFISLPVSAAVSPVPESEFPPSGLKSGGQISGAAVSPAEPPEACPECDGHGEVPVTPGQPGDGPMRCPRCELLDATHELLAACERMFTSPDTKDEPDDEPVMLPAAPGDLTFGMLRRARKAHYDASA
jgi:hypothetical protein